MVSFACSYLMTETLRSGLRSILPRPLKVKVQVQAPFPLPSGRYS
jgi:hypothetical protein